MREKSGVSKRPFQLVAKKNNCNWKFFKNTKKSSSFECMAKPDDKKKNRRRGLSRDTRVQAQQQAINGGINRRRPEPEECAAGDYLSPARRSSLSTSQLEFIGRCRFFASLLAPQPWRRHTTDSLRNCV